MTSTQLLLIAWIPTMLLGVGVSMKFMIHAIEDKAFLRALRLNSVREMLVEVNFSEAMSQFIFKFVYGSLGLWSLVLRVQNPTPLTQTGWLVFLTLFLPILWMTLTDMRNYRRKLKIVQGFVRETVEVVTVHVPEKERVITPHIPDSPPAHVDPASHQ